MINITRFTEEPTKFSRKKNPPPTNSINSSISSSRPIGISKTNSPYGELPPPALVFEPRRNTNRINCSTIFKMRESQNKKQEIEYTFKLILYVLIVKFQLVKILPIRRKFENYWMKFI
ncbi:hypothetical protein ACTFIY_010686 [Dictyostelium cf. discoideum]